MGAMAFRVQLLLLCVASWCTFSAVAQIVPLPGPDLRRCNVSHIVDNETCCLPPPLPNQKLVQFRVNTSIPIGIRLSAQSAIQNPAYLKKLTTAYARMLALRQSDPNDPRGMDNQRRLHCSYCTDGFTYGKEYNLHGGWFFPPFHRMLLYHHERILADLLGDASFKIPFWNWDNPRYMKLPAVYYTPGSPLHNPNRNKNETDYWTSMKSATSQRQVRLAMYGAYSTDLFFGCPQQGCRDLGVQNYEKSAGALEVTNHNNIHSAVGSSVAPYHDMGALEFAGRDPAFYAHHANVDRLWSIWKTLPKTNNAARCDPSTPGFLQTRFTMYSAGKEMVSTAVSDVLDHVRSLRYDYERVQLTWLQTTVDDGRDRLLGENGFIKLPVPASLRPAEETGTFLEAADPFNTGGDPIVLKLKNPIEPPAEAGQTYVNILILEGFEFQRSEKFSLRVFVNKEKADIHTLRDDDNPNYLGTYYHTAGLTGRDMKRNIRLPIGRTLNRLGHQTRHIVITLVPSLKGTAHPHRHRRGHLSCQRAFLQWVPAEIYCNGNSNN